MNKKYQIIYADPPWSYKRGNIPNGGVNKHYNTMPIEDICALSIPTDKNAILYLWATTALLPEALQVMKAWGFEYKSSMIWDKVKLGVGYWFRGQHEFLLVGVKGKVSPPPSKLRVSSILRQPRTEHSRKPDKIRDLIATWYPDATKLEMFARNDGNVNLFNENPFDGWDTFGNESVGGIELQKEDRYDKSSVDSGAESQ